MKDRKTEPETEREVENPPLLISYKQEESILQAASDMNNMMLTTAHWKPNLLSNLAPTDLNNDKTY